MGRKLNHFEIGQYYHIVTRANHRDFIFVDDEDFDMFYFILEKAYQMYPYTLIAFCIMSNHYHLLLRCLHVEQYPKLMGYINKRYTEYYNKKHRLVGSLWQKRYYYEKVEDISGLLAVSTYIHYNPVKACMVKQPQHYSFSSARNYYEDTPLLFLYTSLLLNLFQGTEEEQRQQYIDWMKNHIMKKETEEE